MRKTQSASNSAGIRSSVIAVHSSVLGGGAAPNLLSYLTSFPDNRCMFISHPLLYVKESYAMSSRYELHQGDVTVRKQTAYHWNLPEPLLYVKDILYTLFWTFALPGRQDVYFGCDTLMAFTGIILKYMGKVERVVYFGVDYFPVRFENRLMNRIYHAIDRFCVRYATETWNVSGQMQKARAKNGMVGSAFRRQHTVPMGIWFDKSPRLDLKDIREHSMFYIGTISDVMGLDLAIRAFPKLLKKYPDMTLDIVGIGPAKEELETMVRNFKLGKHIRFYGLVTEGSVRNTLFARSGIGIAPFNTTILDDRVKNADPVKLKEYLSFGMPIIVSDAIANPEQIRKAGCGVVIKYSEAEFINAVSRILKDTKTYRQFRERALAFVRQFDWKRIFETNIRRIASL